MFEEEEFEGKKVQLSTWKYLLGKLGKDKTLLAILIGISMIQAVVEVSVPMMSAYALNHYVGEMSGMDLRYYIILFVALVLVQTIVNYLYHVFAGKIETHFTYTLRKELFEKLQRLSFSYYDKNSAGWILARVTSDVSRLGDMIGWGMGDVLWAVFYLVGMSVVMLVVNVRYALIILATVPFLALISVYFQKKLLKEYRATRRLNSKITGAFSEGISGAKTVKTLHVEDKLEGEFQELSKEYRLKKVHAARINSIFTPLVTSLSTIAIAFLLNLGAKDVVGGVVEFGTLALFINYARSFYDPIDMLANYMPEFQMAQANAERIMGLLDAPIEIVDTEEVVAKYGDVLNPKEENYEELGGDVTFEDVTFYYNENEPVLEHFNLEVKKGQTIGLVGETGSGKSTLVNLVCRFYEPKSGRILIDGKDIQERSTSWLHHNLGYVLQSPFLFDGTIKENIRFGKLDASDEEIIEACKLVNAHDFIMKLEDGYDTNVNEGGARLSTGEKQLISFARALIADPKLLILDEATSSIDTEKEKMIQDAIEVIQKNRTSFVVAHRLSTIVNADRILVLKHGKVVEDGTHLELMAKKGYYYRLYTNQYNEDLEKNILKLDKAEA